MPWHWPKIDHFQPCYFALQTIESILPPGINSLDLLQRTNGKRELVKTIYDTLLGMKLNYALEPPSPSQLIQKVRKADEILRFEKRGNCLDLAVLFCSVCLHYDLLPILIRMDDHALVAISVTHTTHDFFYRPERPLFDNVMIEGDEKFQKLIELIKSEAYLAVECTGFAHSQSLSSQGSLPECTGREPNGAMTFARAVEAGFEQLSSSGRHFRRAYDIATAHRYFLADSELDVRGTLSAGSYGASREPEPSDPLPYLLDRSEQEEALKEAVLAHRSTCPQRPLICVIHGNESEYHGAFFERLKKLSLPRILHFWYPEEVMRASIESHDMKLSLKKVTATNWENVFWDDLTYALAGDRPALRPDIIKLVSQRELAVMIRVTLSSGQLEGVSLEWLTLFLKFWDQWPNLPERLLLIVCLSIKYQPKHEPKWKFVFFKSHGFNERLRQSVKDLDFAAHTNLSGFCLPELQAIPQEDVEEAISHEAVRRRYDLTEIDVVKLYNTTGLCTPQGCIPMMTVIEKLSERQRRRR